MCRCDGENIYPLNFFSDSALVGSGNTSNKLIDLHNTTVMNKKLIIFLLGCVCLTSAKAETTQEEKVYILSTIWRNVRDNFAFPDHFEQANPDSLFRAFLPEVMKTESDSDFELLITEFLAKFNDGHTRFFPGTPSSAVSATYPVKFIGIGGKVYVRNIGKQYIKKIPVGSRLVKIDGVPVQDFLETRVYPYIAAPNADWKFRKSLDSFLNRADSSDVKLEFLTPKNKTEKLSLSRIEPQLRTPTNGEFLRIQGPLMQKNCRAISPICGWPFSQNLMK